MTNNTDEKLYLLHFRSFISVFEGDIDITDIFRENSGNYFGNDYDAPLVGRMEIDTLQMKGFKSMPDDMIYREEEKIFLGLNKIDTILRTTHEDGGYSLMLDLYLRLSKYDGLLIDAHETIELYEPIDVLFDDRNERSKAIIQSNSEDIIIFYTPCMIL